MKWIKDKLQLVGIVLLIAAFILLIGGRVRWQWGECRGVGHGVMYCIHKMGSK